MTISILRDSPITLRPSAQALPKEPSESYRVIYCEHQPRREPNEDEDVKHEIRPFTEVPGRHAKEVEREVENDCRIKPYPDEKIAETEPGYQAREDLPDVPSSYMGEAEHRR